MRNRLLLICAIALLPLPTPARADAGWTEYVRVTELVASDRHYYRFRLALEDNPSGCRDESWFYRDFGGTGADKIFDTLLEAIKSNLRVRVYVTGICNLDGYSEISAVGIVP